MKLKPIQSLLLVVFGVLLLFVAGWTIAREIDHPWKSYQNAFKGIEKKILLEKRESLENRKKGALDQALKKIETQALLIDRQINMNQKRTAKIDQIWIADLKRADRCLTCHAGMEKTAFARVKGVYTKHPGDFLKTHPVKTFGCTLCHDGDGMGLTEESGHGNSAHWNRPLLQGDLVESSCRRCHPYDEKIPHHIDFPQAPVLSRGKNLYVSKGCRGCHELAGFERPESIAPVLSRVGEKVNGRWLEKWLKRPKDYLPDTIMPFFDLPEKEIGDLRSFLLSRKGNLRAAVPGDETADVQRGKKQVHEIGCLGCHKVGQAGGTFGPDLTAVAGKVNPDWQMAWLRNPLSYDPQTVMPDFRLSSGGISDISAYLRTLGKEEPDARIPADLQAVNQGKALFGKKGCTGCHTMEGFAMGFKKAPEHTGFGEKRVDELDFGNVTDIPRTRAAWVLAKEKSPRVFSTDTIRLIMPNFELSNEEAGALRVFVLGFTSPDLPRHYLKPLWEPVSSFLAGMRTIETFNCIGCHKIGLVEKPLKLTEDLANGYFWTATSYALEDISADGKTLFSKGQPLSDLHYNALAGRDPSIGDAVFRHRWFLDMDTIDYLKLDMGFENVTAAGMDEGEIIAFYKDLNFAPPILHYEGIKVQPNWLYHFLKKPYLIRPLARATMPTFHLTEAEIVDLVGFFEARDHIEHNPFFATTGLKPGETRTAGKIFKVCLQCHYFDQQRTRSSDRFGGLKGPNLAEAGRRLRPAYIKQWIKYPDLIVPGTQMKNFFYYFDIYERFEVLEKDETGFPEIPPEKKIDMMSRFLMNPFKGVPLPGNR